ncbi:MAG: ATP-binding protein [Rhodospirillales bacterium]|nr:ATP-binding protein [Rhodospirillales bacterium]MDH3790713.1 ATP-binding protein [Rhodospirillales bacterium]MDH3909719.1 ATP-binding protein [Rhodospirillales bacterium]MDH3919456.1 ATP-binding protein [Rhodospirillales bacterium]MDH3966048.1 ATP-binding protein [Rhodospirillales bacterium]
MKLGSKTLLVLAGVLTFSVALNFGVLQNLVFPSFVSLEEEAAEQNLNRVTDAFQGEFRSLAAFTADWGHWDDTYEYAGGEKPAYEEDNLYFDSLATINLNFLYIFDSAGAILWYGLFDLETGNSLPADDFPLNNLSPTHTVLQHADTESLHTGFMNTTLGPIYFASRAILTSDVEGPSRGTFIMGRFFNDAELARLREQTHVDFQAWPLDGSPLPSMEQEAVVSLEAGGDALVSGLDDNIRSGYTLLRDPAGAPALLLRADTPRKITAIGWETINYALLFMVMVGLVDMIAMWLLLRGVVIGPLSNLTQKVLSIAKTKDRSRRLALDRSDEIGVLAKEFDGMLDELLETEGLAVLGKITATVSHELRNPLGAMRNSVFAVAESTRGKGLDVERALERVDRNIQRCDGIIRDLLDFAAQRELDTAAIAIDDWIAKRLDEQDAPEGIAIFRTLDAPGAEALVDTEQIKCVIDKLVDNACQAITEAEASGDEDVAKAVRIETRLAGGRLEISVSDEGPGIPPEVLPKIFEPLFSTRGFGVGVGLPTAKRIMELHGGGIEITSEPGQGTRVLLWLPLCGTQQAAA